MATNKRRHANAVPIASFATWMVIGLFVLIAGLGYVYCKNQLHTTGAQIKKLESELSELRNRNESARTNIAHLSSTKTLQDRFDSGFITLTPITDDKVVTVRNQISERGGRELQPASNPVARP
jgi:hypothetical protein